MALLVGVTLVASSLPAPTPAEAAPETEDVAVAGLSDAELSAEAGTPVGDPSQRGGSPLELPARVDLAHDVIRDAPAVVLPEAVSFDVRLDEVVAGEFAASKAPGSVVRVGAPGKDAEFAAPESVAVEVLSQKLTEQVGGQGLAFEVVRQDGRSNAATVVAEIEYSGFAHLFGGDWAQRLRFAWYPECTQLQLAERGACGDPVWLPIVNDVAAQRFTVEIPIDRKVASFERQLVAPDTPGMNLGGDQRLAADQGDEVTVADLEAAGVSAAFGRSFVRQSGGAGGGIGAVSGGQSGTSGSFTATGLAAAGKWSVGGASGNFSYSYPIPAATTPVGIAPELSLSYSSGGVDGFTSSENTQGGLWGLGWELSGLGFIERRYRSCSTDGSGATAYAADMCWYGDTNGNATISVAGRSAELVATGSGNLWRLKDDPFWRVQRCSQSAPCAGVSPAVNGDNDREHWVVTTPEGVQYWFGIGKFTNGTTNSNSVFYEPVYGNNTGEPCNGGSNWCTQAYRWNLDRVVDANGNVMQIAYVRETNMYQRGSSNGYTGTATSYVRGGYPDYVEHGIGGGTGARPGRLYFMEIERCLPKIADPFAGCGTTDANWPDTPLDLDCSASPCAEKSPSFYTKMRMLAIDSWSVDQNGEWRPVDRISLAHEHFASTGTGGKLYLRSVQRTGNPGIDPPAGSGGAQPFGYTEAPLAAPKVRFDYTQLASRADAVPFNIWRLSVVKDEMGLQTVVTYGRPNICPANPPLDGWDKNTWNCWNVWTSPDGQAAGWARHHKYVVTSITNDDLVGGSPSVTTDYTYFFTLSGADELYLWHHDNDPITPGSNQTWGDWRGYPVVITTTGTTKTETRYYRGMDGDKNSDTTTKSVNVQDSEGGSTSDPNWLNGMVRETRSLDGSNQRISGTMHEYTVVAQTATMTMPQYSPRIARMVREANTDGDVGGSTAKQTRTEYSYSTATGMVQMAWNRGDGSTSADNRCTSTYYAENTTKHLYLVRQSTLTSGTSSLGCPAMSTLQAQTRTYFDGHNTDNTAAPTAGNVTRSERWTASGSSVSTYATFDGFGRPLQTTDANGNVTTTSYSPTTAALTASTTVSAPLGMLQITSLDPHRMAPDVVVDQNLKSTDYRYDSLGRTLGVTTPVSSFEAVQFAYTLSVDGSGLLNAPAKVETKQLYDSAGSRRSTFVLYDGFGRERETQSEHAPNASGRTVTATRYNGRGLVASKSLAFNATGTPGSGLVNELYPPNDHAFFYDETERVYRDEFRRASGASMAVNWSTLTSYDGLETIVTSPEGRQSRSVVDVFGQTIETSQLNTVGNAYSMTTNTYTFRGELDTSTDHDGNVRNYGYDLAGRLLSSVDPDQGAMSFTYDANGNQQTSTDAVGSVVHTSYDALNRPTARRVGAAGDGVFLAEWTYYTTAPYKGQAKDVIGYGPNATTTAGVDSYKVTVNAYDNAYRPTQKTYDFPNAGAGLTGPFAFGYTYNEDNSPKTITYPAIGSLPAETLTPSYYGLTGLPDRLQTSYGGGAYLVDDTTYTDDGMLETRVLHKSSELQVTRSYTYSTNTRRLASLKAVVDTSTAGSPRPTTTIQEDVFAYDDDSNVIGLTDTVANQRQCFVVDHYSRLERAWTQTQATACQYDADGNPATTADNPAPDNVGPSPYDHTYNYETADGGRTGNIGSYDTRVWPAGTATNHDFSYVSGSRPHAPVGLDGASYTYLANGNMSSSTVGGVVSIFGYTPEGRLGTIGESTGQSTSMVYDPSGQRLLRRVDNPGAANDEATLYIEGHELKATYNSAGVLQGTSAMRYFTSGGATVGLRNDSGQVQWILGNHQGSASVSIPANQTVAVTQRYEPFGKVRGATNQLPTDRDFLGQIQDDSTSLNYLNARYYDPNLLHFITVDPLLNPGYFDAISDQIQGTADQLSWFYEEPPEAVAVDREDVFVTFESYAYASNNPTTDSDPTGLEPGKRGGGGGLGRRAGLRRGGGGGRGKGAAGGGGGGAPSTVGSSAGRGTTSSDSRVTRFLTGRANTTHPKTRVQFDSTGYPVFPAKYEYQMGPQVRTFSDSNQNVLATRDLSYSIRTDPTVARQFTGGERRAIHAAAESSSGRISGYTWHHHQNGRTLQLVDRQVHSQTFHYGGRSVMMYDRNGNKRPGGRG